MKLTILFILLTITVSFTLHAQHPRHKKQKHDQTVESDSLFYHISETLYFPTGIFCDSMTDAAGDSFSNNWYSWQLSALHESVLPQDTIAREVYRFTYLPSFAHPLSITIEHRDTAYTLHWKITNGSGDYDPGKLMVDQQKLIDKAHWDKFQSMLNQIDFWKLSVSIPVLGCDGEDWILEGKKPKEYHVVQRWSPRDKTAYYNCCNYLFTLTGIKAPIRRKY